jgi:hypothetical protein
VLSHSTKVGTGVQVGAQIVLGSEGPPSLEVASALTAPFGATPKTQRGDTLNLQRKTTVTESSGVLARRVRPAELVRNLQRRRAFGAEDNLGPYLHSRAHLRRMREHPTTASRFS